MSTGLNLELAKTVLRQGELRLSAQLMVGLAAVQRATALTGIFAVAATAALGFSTWAMGSTTANIPLGAGGIVTGLFFGIAAIQCVRVALPAKFATVGAEPNNWWEEGVEGRPLAECLRRESENYQKRIGHNQEVNIQGARLLRCGAYLGIAAPFIGLVTWAGAWVVARAPV